MKGRVETGYLRQRGIKCERSSDRREIMRLVQRCQRDQRLQFDQQFRSDAFWPDVSRASMNYSMAKRGEPTAAELRSSPTGLRRILRRSGSLAALGRAWAVPAPSHRPRKPLLWVVLQFRLPGRI